MPVAATAHGDGTPAVLQQVLAGVVELLPQQVEHGRCPGVLNGGQDAVMTGLAQDLLEAVGTEDLLAFAEGLSAAAEDQALGGKPLPGVLVGAGGQREFDRVVVAVDGTVHVCGGGQEAGPADCEQAADGDRVGVAGGAVQLAPGVAGGVGVGQAGLQAGGVQVAGAAPLGDRGETVCPLGHQLSPALCQGVLGEQGGCLEHAEVVVQLGVEVCGDVIERDPVLEFKLGQASQGVHRAD